jgi:3-hydroxymyristoyl/3-hydroxydecanoyl-(acyl carrier protein) dehydratase
VSECFGPAYALADTHVETPRIASGDMLLMGEVAELDPAGGPWGRGYLRAVRPLSPDDWFYKGHFKNDPCMPGTLMFEGCLQAMAFYLVALGYTLDKDGWRFEPVPDLPYRLRCRGQATPASRELVYEVFASEVHAAAEPVLYADLLCTVDGVKAFHCRRMGLRLVPDTPMARRRELGPAPSTRAVTASGVKLDFPALLACAWGKPSEALGPLYAPFDAARRMPRLPGPPYHFMSRVTHVLGELGALQPGAEIEVEYDIPADAWFFRENRAPTIPFCVLLEASLQPCGWLALGTGIPLETDEGLHFRNLDGVGTLHHGLRPESGTLHTRVRLVGVSRSSGMSLVSFDVRSSCGDQLVFEMKTGFGFFPREALANQLGLPTSDDDRAWLTRPSAADFELHALRGGRVALPGAMLFMLDRITGVWPMGGSAGLGRWRAEKDVRSDEWFFKAHFYQDPVQPGSLGLQALLQLLQCAMIAKGLDRGLANPHFEPIALGRALTWKYRGQVVPWNRVISVEIELKEVGEDESGRYATADGSLWVDGVRIYAATDLAMRMVDAPL